MGSRVTGLMRMALRNAWRSPPRTLMTVAAIALSLLGFLMLRTLGGTWREQVAQTPNNRVISRNKLGWEYPLPIHYTDAIRKLDGIRRAVAVRWAGLYLPGKPNVFFDTSAVEARPFVDMHNELECPREQQEAFIRERRGAFVSAELARELGWKLNDHISFQSHQFKQPVELDIRAIFRSNREGFARRQLYLHLEYFNQALPSEDRDRTSIVAAEIEDPARGARLSKSIDMHFDDQEVRTATFEDKALNAAVTGRFSAILRALNLVSLLTLGVVLLILMNTMVMCARERSQEFAVLRAIGFGRREIAFLLGAEAACLGLGGSALALLLSRPVVERWVSRFAERTMSLPPLAIHLNDAASMVALAAAIGVLAAYLSIRRTFGLPLVDALRHVD